MIGRGILRKPGVILLLRHLWKLRTEKEFLDAMHTWYWSRPLAVGESPLKYPFVIDGTVTMDGTHHHTPRLIGKVEMVDFLVEQCPDIFLQELDDMPKHLGGDLRSLLRYIAQVRLELGI
jgi:hypothetical protein